MTKTDTDDEVIDLAGFLRLMGGISEAHARRMWATGDLPRPFKVGARLMWSRSHVLEFARRRAEEAQRETAHAR
jgi:predicted DNA-binding transcriptional regulator AlpA